MMPSQSGCSTPRLSWMFPCEIHASYIFGFLDKSTRREDAAAGGTHVPLRMASSIIRRCRLRRMSDRTTMAEDTPRSRTRVAIKIERY